MAIFELKVTMLIVIYDSIDIENDLGFPLFAFFEKSAKFLNNFRNPQTGHFIWRLKFIQMASIPAQFIQMSNSQAPLTFP